MDTNEAVCETNDDGWQKEARLGKIQAAIKVRRYLHGGGLMDNKAAVEHYLSTLSPDQYVTALQCSPLEMTDIVADIIERDYPETDPPQPEAKRRERYALTTILQVVQRQVDYSKAAKTGPTPPSRHLKYAGFHWLRTRVRGDLVVMQWQPVTEKWCHCGQVATGADIDTEGWTYVSACSMPPFDEELAEFNELRSVMRQEIDAHYSEKFAEKWKRLMSFLTENTSF